MRSDKLLANGALVLLVVASLSALCWSALQQGKYSDRAGKCEESQDRTLDGRQKALSCSFKTLEKNIQIQNLTSVPADSVSHLTVHCSDVYYFESSLSGDTFSGLGRVRELSVEFCKISELDEDTFRAFRNLKNFTIRTRNSDWPAMRLAISPLVFRPLHQLERLDLSTNNIWEFPVGVFCYLGVLKMVNLSQNHLQDLTQLGFSGSADLANRTSSCRFELQVLDLSYNDANFLVSGAFRGLGMLHELLLHHNQLGKVDDNAFEGLGSLQLLDMSDNNLVALPEDLFIHTPQLVSIKARNNSLSFLAPGLFRGLQHLVELDLSYNDLRSEWLKDSSFQGLIRLMALDLSHNLITHLNPQVFRDMYGVQVLRLSFNQLEVLPPACFTSCVNLHTLDLSNNQLQIIPDRAFLGMNVISFLALDNNEISEIEPKALSNLTSLQDLNINGNNIKEIPLAIKYLGMLQTLDLGDNQISSLHNLPVGGLQFLYGLRLLNNRIAGNISKDTFKDLPSLKILNLAKNGITHIENGAFANNKNLQAIRLDANMLTTINDLFESLPNLEWLNVSDNNIEIFDYHFIPPSLLWLDIHKNKIHELGNYLGRHDLQLNTLDASFNKIKHISSIQIPDSVKFVFLNDNRISVVEPFTFFKKENLTRVDLVSNKLTRMEISALRLTVISPEKQRPEFYMGGNSFICDCDMEWLQRVNNLEHAKIYPTVMDLESIYCQMPFARNGPYLPLVEVSPSQFLCQYESHCFATCHCCDFDACDCEMICPSGCECYHDQSWSSNIVDCSLRQLDSVPDRIPMDATEVYLDGSDFRNLSSHAFIGRKRLQMLYINNSGIHTIYNETFSGLSRLTVLHLQDNLIESLRGHEFRGVELIRELYLHNNQLRYIHQHSFVSLSHLEILTLHNNRLINFPVWRLVDNPYLRKVSLADNLWTCECQFLESFQIWLSGNERKVSNGREIRCHMDVAPERAEGGFTVADFNATACVNVTSAPAIVSHLTFGNLLHPVIAIIISLFLIIVFVVCFVYRNTLRVWVHSHCGLRLCYEGASTDDRDKLFDAFVSYSAKDEAWVNQVLAGELERGDHFYTICLHYRDFPVTAHIAETIVEAVESSRRTIIVLSKNFIENEWCRFQFKSAHHEVLKKRRKRLIVIVLGEIPSRDLDPDLRLYLKTNTCIHTNDKLFWEKLKFAMPDVSANQRVVHTYSTIPERPGTNKYSVTSPSVHNNHAHQHHPLQQPTSDPYWA